MPTYEYVCEKCGHAFELFQGMTEPSLTVCPKKHCAQKKWGRGRVTRQIGSGAGLIFKGSGFYITDYRSEKYKAAAKQDAPPAPPAAGDNKPASPPKTEGKPANPPKASSKPKSASAAKS